MHFKQTGAEKGRLSALDADAKRTNTNVLASLQVFFFSFFNWVREFLP